MITIYEDLDGSEVTIITYKQDKSLVKESWVNGLLEDRDIKLNITEEEIHTNLRESLIESADILFDTDRSSPLTNK